MVKHRNKALVLAIAAATFGAPGAVPIAFGEDTIEEVVVTGSRRAPRSVGDSAAPIDVLSGDDFENQGAMEMADMLRTLIPSYNVNTQPISDASTLVRPANLRGLPPDNTLILVNGKRRHRSAVISFLGGGISDGAQGPDISVIPNIALKQVEVLRDGASAQYGSDAIAGVINFILKDNAEGFSFEARVGETFEGDGESWKYAGNIGLPLGSNGFANLSFEVTESNATSQSVQRGDAAQLTALGNNNIRNPAQIWGSPDITDDFKFFANIGLDLDDNTHAYLFGNYAERKVLGGFFFRNPTNRPNVFSVDDGLTRLVGDLTPGPLGQVNPGLGDGDGVACPTVNVRIDGTVSTSVPIDQAALDAIIADPNCFVFNEQFPGGFTPNFGGTITDYSIVAGVRGEAANGLTWDISAGVGSSDVKFVIKNTINASLGPKTPTEFRPGDYTQFEKNFNADFGYPVEVGLYSPLHIGFGFEFREEQFEVTSGELASWQIGPLFDQGFGIGSNGFGGFGPQDAGEFDRGNFALYVDLEADITEKLLLGIAVRYEDFDDFGDTTNGKVSFRYAFTDSFAIRATASTGFRAPTPGQSNISNVSTVAGDDGILVQRGTIPPTNPVAQSKGGKQLQEEESTNYSVGFVWDITNNFNVTVDYFDIDVDDRITQSATKVITPEEAAALEASGIVGASDLTEFRFFTNDFDTNTSGFDIVATYSADWALGNTNISLAYNQTETEVESASDVIDRERKGELEDFLPETRWNLTGVHHYGNWRFLARVSYYDEWTDPSNDPANDITFDEEILLDVEVGYTWNDRYTLIAGAQNVLDEFPDKDPRSLSLGNKFPEASPFGFNGGFYYTRFRVDL